jgi:hypothetical protein
MSYVVQLNGSKVSSELYTVDTVGKFPDVRLKFDVMEGDVLRVLELTIAPDSLSRVVTFTASATKAGNSLLWAKRDVYEVAYSERKALEGITYT